MNGTGNAITSIEEGTGTGGVDNSMIPALYQGLFSNAKTNFSATARCSTGNCTWPLYQNLAICNTCADLTSQLKMNKVHVKPPNEVDDTYDTDFYTLPNGFGLTGVHRARTPNLPADDALLNITVNMQGTYTIPADLGQPLRSSMAFSQNGSIFMTVFAVGASPGTIIPHPDTDFDENAPFGPPVAFECALQFCIKSMNASFVNGLLQEEVVSTWVDQTLNISQSQVIVIGPEDSGRADLIFRPPSNPPRTFVVTQDALGGTGSWLASQLIGNVTMITDRSLDSGLQGYSSDLMQAFYQAMNSSATGFQDTMDNLANSFSLALRNLPYQPAGIRGTAFSTTSHFTVTWPWLILPLVVLLASLVFLVAVMVETKRKGLVPWSNNILATMFHGFEQRPAGRPFRDYQHVMEDDAEQILLVFQEDGEGGHLVIRGADESIHL